MHGGNVLTKKSFIKGAAILGIALVLGKVLGALYRIPLANLLEHDKGFALYQYAYPIYSFLLVISTAGLPTAISKMVSERLVLNDPRGAHQVFRIAFKILAIFGSITTIIMIIGSPLFASLTSAQAGLSFMAIAPALLFVSMISAFRGYFQGMQRMTPSAISEFLEQLFKMVFGLALANAFIPFGYPQAAAGALLGISLTELAVLILISAIYLRSRRAIFENISKQKTQIEHTRKETVRQLIRIAVPIAIGACIMPLVATLDSGIIANILKGVLHMSEKKADSLFAIYSGYVNPIATMPTMMTLALAASLVPAISESRAAGRLMEMQNKASTGFKLSMLLGLPCAVGLWILARPVLQLLYSHSLTVEADMQIAVNLMHISTIGVFFLFMVQTVTGILQGLGRVRVPVTSLAIGAGVKVILSFLLISRPEINIYGAPIGTITCYFVAATINTVIMRKEMKLSLPVMDFLVKPIIATAIMGAATYFIFNIASRFASSNVSLVIAIIAAVVIYALAVIVLGVLRPEDMSFMPGGRKLSKLFYRLGVWKQKEIR